MLMERLFSCPVLNRDRVTATEVINGTECRIVLEQDMFGRYRESLILPIERSPARLPLCVQAADGDKRSRLVLPTSVRRTGS